MNELGRLIRKKRRDRDVTQEGLAKMVGVSRSAIANIEVGFNMPSVDTLSKLAAALEISGSELSAVLMTHTKQEAS